MDGERKTKEPWPTEPIEEEIEDLAAPAETQKQVAGGAQIDPCVGSYTTRPE